MKWFYKWLRGKIRQADVELADPTSEIPYSHKMNAIAGSRYIESNSTMNFTISKANGGYVVSYHVYDKKTDRSDQRLHIITDDKDLGEELGKIISFETLRA
jgi:hypothetical protein